MRYVIVQQKDTFERYPFAKEIFFQIMKLNDSDNGFICYIDQNNKHWESKSDKSGLFIITNPVRSTWRIKYWYSVQLPKLLKSLRPDKVIYLNGLFSGSQKKIPYEVLLVYYSTLPVPNPAIKRLHHKIENWQQLVFKLLPRQILSDAKMLTYSKVTLDQYSSIASQKLDTRMEIWHPDFSDKISRLSWDQKQAIKDQYGEGEEYFIARGNFRQPFGLQNILKAFSYFKKWQKTAMKLVLYSTDVNEKNAECQQLLDSYYFRKDIVILTEMSKELYQEIITSSYGYMVIAERDDDVISVIEGIKAEAFTICNAFPSLTELAADSAYVIEDGSFEKIGQAMIDVYRNESIRGLYIKKTTLFLQNNLDNHPQKNKADILSSWLIK